MRNRHPVDELADVRAEIKRLEEREKALREIVIDSGRGTEGDEYEASVTVVQSTRLDTAAVRRAFGEDQLAPYLKSSEVVTVKVKTIDRSYLADADAA